MEVFLTVSPQLRSLRDQKSIFLDDLLYISKIRLCSKKFIIYPEFDVTGRLHYHGIITIHDKVKWFKSVLPTLRKTLGFCDIKRFKTFKDKLSVSLYIKKDWQYTKDILDLDDPIMPKHKKRLIVRPSMLDNGITLYFPEEK